MLGMMTSYPYGEVPGHFHVVFVVIQPHLCHPQGVTLHSAAQVRGVRFMKAFDVSDL